MCTARLIRILKRAVIPGCLLFGVCTTNPPLESDAGTNRFEIGLIYPQGKVQASSFHRREIEYEHHGTTRLFEFAPGSSSPVVIEADLGDRIIIQVREYSTQDYLVYQGDTLHLVGYEDVVYLDIVMRLQVPPPSFLIQPSDSLLVVGNAYEISLSYAAGGAGVAVRCSLLTGPLGMTVSDHGLVSWLPLAALPQTQTMVAVIDEYEQSDTLRWLLGAIADDAIAPVVQITTPPSSPYQTLSPSLSVSGTATDNKSVASLSYSLSNGQVIYFTQSLGHTNGVWSIPSISLSLETTYVFITALDSVGNTGSDTVVVILDVSAPDNTPPIVTITSPSSSTLLTNSQNMTISGTAGDISGIQSVLYALTGSTVASGTATGTESWSFSTVLNEGITVVVISAQDTKGNIGYDTVTVGVDITPPSPPTVTGPLSPTPNLMPTWTWQSVDGMGLFRYRLDNGSYLDTSNQQQYTPPTPLSQGSHVLYVQERDSAGNWSNDGSYAVMINTGSLVAPTVSGPSITNNQRPTWNWQSGGGDQVYRYKMDNNDLSIGAAVGPDTFHVPDQDLSEGSHTLYVQEQYGLDWSPTGSLAVMIDVTAPGTPIIEGLSFTNDMTPEWQWTSGGGGNGTYQYQLDGVGWVTTTSTTHTPSSDLSEGSHTLEVQECDDAGNWSASGSRTISIDITPPDPPVISGVAITNDATPQWTYASGGSGANVWQYRINNGQWTSTTALFQEIATPVADHSYHTLEVRESDAAGNWSAVSSITTYYWSLHNTNLVSWYDATDANAVTVNGSNNVTQWKDKSASQSHATVQNNASGYMTSGIGSKPSIQFDRSNSESMRYTNLAQTGSYTVFIVHDAINNTGSSTSYQVFLHSLYGGLSLFHIPWTGTEGYTSYFDNAWHNIAPSQTGSQYETWVMDGVGGTGTLYRNGVLQGSASYNGTNLATTIGIGSTAALSANNYYNGMISEILVYDRILNITEQQNIENYIKNKYGF